MIERCYSLYKSALSILNDREIINEFIRYCFIGGLAFVGDFTVLFIFQELILPHHWYSLYISTGLGFATGTVINYVLSINFVFISVKGTNAGKTLYDFLVFVLVGVIGLFLTELGMFLGTKQLDMNYLIVKMIVTIVVLLWNYSARKLLIFRNHSIDSKF